VDAGRDDGDLPQVAAVTVEGRREVWGAIAFSRAVRKDGGGTRRQGWRQLCGLDGLNKLGRRTGGFPGRLPPLPAHLRDQHKNKREKQSEGHLHGPDVSLREATRGGALGST